MNILRSDLENKERLGQLVEMKLAHMGVYEDDGIRTDIRARIAIREYFVGILQEHLNNSEDNILTEYFDGSELAVWGFIAGYKACLKRQLAPQLA